MKLAELIGDDGALANVAIKWVETTLHHPGACTCESTLDSMEHGDKVRLVRGLCGLLIMWSYNRHGGEPYPSGENELVISVRKEVEWEINADRQGLYAKYLASNILTASTGEEQEFYRQLGLLEPDKGDSLAIRKRAIERVIQELVTWFRYYTWNHIWRGYGQSGEDNVQSALEYLQRDMVNIIEKEKQARDTVSVEPAETDDSSAPCLERDLIENPDKYNARVLAYIKAAYYEASTDEERERLQQAGFLKKDKKDTSLLLNELSKDKKGYLATIKRTIKRRKTSRESH